MHTWTFIKKFVKKLLSISMNPSRLIITSNLRNQWLLCSGQEVVKKARISRSGVAGDIAVNSRRLSTMGDNSEVRNNTLEKPRGALIVLEGCDKAGKSTQCRMLVDALNKKGWKSHLFTFPDRTTDIGRVIDEYLKCSKNLSDEAIHLLFSSNRWEVIPRICELLKKGESVVLDRYAFSGVAFSAAKGKMSLEWCKAPDVGLPQPDAVYFLNLSEEATSSRGDFGHERYEKVEFQKKVKALFFELHDPNYWKIIDADCTKEDLHEQLLRLSMELIASSDNKPILPLWANNTSKVTSSPSKVEVGM